MLTVLALTSAVWLLFRTKKKLAYNIVCGRTSTLKTKKAECIATNERKKQYICVCAYSTKQSNSHKMTRSLCFVRFCAKTFTLHPRLCAVRKYFHWFLDCKFLAFFSQKILENFVYIGLYFDLVNAKKKDILERPLQYII